MALNDYWTFYPVLTDVIRGLSYKFERLELRVEGKVTWAGRGAVRLVGVPPVVEHEWNLDPLW